MALRMIGTCLVCLGVLSIDADRAGAAIVFIDLDDLLVDEATPVFANTFQVQIRFEPIPLGDTVGVVLDESDYMSRDGVSAQALPPGTMIGPGVSLISPAALVGFDTSGGSAVPIDYDFFDATGNPVRGIVGVSSPQAASDPHYGWIELTVEYDPARNASSVILHHLAYEDAPGRAILAGAVPEPTTTSLALAALCLVGRRRM